MSKPTQPKQIVDLAKEHFSKKELHHSNASRLREIQAHLKILRSTADKRAYLDNLEQTEKNKVLIELARSYLRAGIHARVTGPLGEAIQSFKEAKGEE
jgi:predicted ABC-type exoprotein transport system permease subunit